MTSLLDKLEVTSSLMQDLGCQTTVQIECCRSKFDQIKKELEEEYDLSVVEDVKLTKEKIDNQLSNIYGLKLHGVLYTITIKD